MFLFIYFFVRGNIFNFHGLCTLSLCRELIFLLDVESPCNQTAVERGKRKHLIPVAYFVVISWAWGSGKAIISQWSVWTRWIWSCGGHAWYSQMSTELQVSMGVSCRCCSSYTQRGLTDWWGGEKWKCKQNRLDGIYKYQQVIVHIKHIGLSEYFFLTTKQLIKLAQTVNGIN